MIPYVKNHVYVVPIMNEGGVDATLGFNPVALEPGARQQNELVVTSLGTAACDAESATLFAAPASPSLRARPSTPIAPAPRPSHRLASQIRAPSPRCTERPHHRQPLCAGRWRFAANGRRCATHRLNSRFTTFLGAPPTGQWITRARWQARRWLPPTSPVDRRRSRPACRGATDRRLRAQSRRRHRTRVEAGPAGHVRPHRRRPRCQSSARSGSAAAGIYRLGTGQLDLAHDFTDVGTGDRQVDLELRGYGDLALGRDYGFPLSRDSRSSNPTNSSGASPTSRRSVPGAVREQRSIRDLGDVSSSRSRRGTCRMMNSR